MPQPSYPFADLANPAMEELAEEYFGRIDNDYGFRSAPARARHKRHRLIDIAARAFPISRSRSCGPSPASPPPER